ncbi:hypothetical protein AMECASPLE_036292 [Ameca splendens]|uniref:Uncharacterized protein n=1 Tax=Ameca splendens TaxID=208324 RepID=A0ABV1AGL9_9TELE
MLSVFKISLPLVAIIDLPKRKWAKREGRKTCSKDLDSTPGWLCQGPQPLYVGCPLHRSGPPRNVPKQSVFSGRAFGFVCCGKIISNHTWMISNILIVTFIR